MTRLPDRTILRMLNAVRAVETAHTPAMRDHADTLWDRFIGAHPERIAALIREVWDSRAAARSARP